jgi:uncharacterized protein YlxW (UPF0749 family)
MYLRTLLILVLLLAVAVFSALNWSAFTAPTTLSVGVGTFEAPLGLILLTVVALLTVLFLVYTAYLQSTLILDNRRHARELQIQRDLAEQAEASRFNQLHSYLESELGTLHNQVDQSKAFVLERLDQIERELRAALEQTGNSLAAYIGEVEDKFEKSLSKS